METKFLATFKGDFIPKSVGKKENFTSQIFICFRRKLNDLTFTMWEDLILQFIKIFHLNQ